MLLESQSSGDEHDPQYLQTLMDNAVSSGFDKDDVEVGWEEQEVIEGWIQEQNEALKTYADRRKSEYPTIEECVHAILDGELDDLQIKRQVVKDKYPKGDN